MSNAKIEYLIKRGFFNFKVRDFRGAGTLIFCTSKSSRSIVFSPNMTWKQIYNKITYTNRIKPVWIN